MKKRKSNPFSLRLDEELKIKAEKAAKSDRRSLNAWVQKAIEEKLSNYEKEAA